MTKASDNVFPRFLISEGGSTTTPASGNVTVYAKADGLLYSKTDAGAESLVSGAAHEFDYVEITTGGNITATVEASADTIITGSAVVYDGGVTVVIECYLLGLLSPASQTTYLLLFDGSTSLGYIGQGLTNLNPTMYVARRLTPSAASHTYSIRAIVTGGTGTYTAGAGGAGANMPGFIRITRA